MARCSIALTCCAVPSVEHVLDPQLPCLLCMLTGRALGTSCQRPLGAYKASRKVRAPQPAPLCMILIIALLSEPETHCCISPLPHQSLFRSCLGGSSSLQHSHMLSLMYAAACQHSYLVQPSCSAFAFVVHCTAFDCCNSECRRCTAELIMLLCTARHSNVAMLPACRHCTAELVMLLCTAWRLTVSIFPACRH